MIVRPEDKPVVIITLDEAKRQAAMASNPTVTLPERVGAMIILGRYVIQQKEAEQDYNIGVMVSQIELYRRFQEESQVLLKQNEGELTMQEKVALMRTLADIGRVIERFMARMESFDKLRAEQKKKTDRRQSFEPGKVVELPPMNDLTIEMKRSEPDSEQGG